MSKKNNDFYQWFIVTVSAGKEKSIIDSLKEKIFNYGYSHLVKDFKVFYENKVAEKIFTKTDPDLPKSLKNTKTTKWETLPNGNYKQIKSKVVNRFPGYVFVNMIMNKEIWYCIRNTNGVLGFVGSSGNGALPIPISIDEYNVLAQYNTKPNVSSPDDAKIVNDDTSNVVYETNIKVGDYVILNNDSFSNEKGKVKSLNVNSGIAIVQIDAFGREIDVEVPFSKLEIDNK